MITKIMAKMMIDLASFSIEIYLFAKHCFFIHSQSDIYISTNICFRTQKRTNNSLQRCLPSLLSG